MEIKSFCLKSLIVLLVLNLVLTPGLVVAAFAQTATATVETASDDEIQAIQQLAKAGYLGDQKDHYQNAQSLTEDEVTDALLKANDFIMAADLKHLQNGKVTYQAADLQSLLDLVKDKSADIRARKVSAWKLENRLEKMIALLSAPATDEAPPVTTATADVPPATPTAVPVPPTPTPVPVPSLQDFNHLKDSFKTLDDKLTNMQLDFDKKTDQMDKIQKQNDDLKVADAGDEEQMKLIKKLLDRVQEDLKQSEDHVSDIEKRVDKKLVTDSEMKQEMTVMHKDLRDDTEDISVLKQQVAKLDKTDMGDHNPIDDFLNSKWLPGGALLVGLTALTVSLLRK